MSVKKTVIGIDLGTDSIKVVALEVVPGENLPRVLGVGGAVSKGIRKGVIIEPEETGLALKEALESLKKSANIKNTAYYIGLGGIGLGFQKVKGTIAISRADGEITKEDVKRTVKTSEDNLTKLQNREILHKIPMHYKVDNEMWNQDPVGLMGLKLEAETLFITYLTQNAKSVIKTLETAELNVEEMMATPLAAAGAVLSKRDKEIGGIILDLGAYTTSVILFAEGLPFSLEVIPFGSAHITHDIAIGFKTTIEEAEKLKINYGAVGSEAVSFKKPARPAGWDELVYGNYSKKKLAEIIEARLSDIFELAAKHLKKVEMAGLLPAGVFIVGGGANLPGIESFAKDILDLPARVSEPANLGGVKEKIKNPAWAGAVGIALTALEKESSVSQLFRGNSGSFFRWLRAFLP